MDMLRTIMRANHNFFEESAPYTGRFSISEGAITLPEELPCGAYIAIEGSRWHDGIYETPAHFSMPDEVFTGKVWVLHPPAEFLALAEAIENYNEKMTATPYVSESFGGYSYQIATGKNGAALSWQEAFASQMKPYYRMFTEVGL